jgi:DNA-binding NtrC family response regulator
MTAASKPCLFVIDDEPMMGATLELTLSDEYDVQVFQSAALALEALEANGPAQVILCDLMMPGISGMAFHERLGVVRPDLLSKVLYMSGGAYTSDAREFLATSGARSISKPFDFDLLSATLRELRES